MDLLWRSKVIYFVMRGKDVRTHSSAFLLGFGGVIIKLGTRRRGIAVVMTWLEHCGVSIRSLSDILGLIE